MCFYHFGESSIRIIVSHVKREHRRVGRVQLLVDNGYVYEAHDSELELHNYRQLEAEWQTGHYDECPGSRDGAAPQNDADGLGRRSC